MHEYANARIAARRARLLPPDVLARLAAAADAEAMLVMLERFEDWRTILRELGPLVTPPRSGLELAIERHHAACLAGLPALFQAPARALVEALVLPLDLQRVLEVLRRRRAGEPPESVAASVSRGAVLDGAAVGGLARAADARAAARLLGGVRVLTREEAKVLAARWSRGAEAIQLEADLAAAFELARRRRAGAAPDGAAIARILDAERAEADAVAAELRSGGPEAAADLERLVRLERLDRLAARARRDPLGIGVVVGYVAAVEAQTIRLRAALASVTSRWSHDRVAAWLGQRAA